MIFKKLGRYILKLIPIELFSLKVRYVYEYEWKQLLKKFKSAGTNSKVDGPFIIYNPQYMSIGDNFRSLYNLRLEAWDSYQNQKFNPEIIIGHNVIFNTDCHVGCINKVYIGNNVLIASRVYISDHSHGEINSLTLKLPPVKRPLVSKGSVIIKDNVWIGEGACILPGITIGENSIVGANAVVTKNVPANVVVAGNPARILKQL